MEVEVALGLEEKGKSGHGCRLKDVGVCNVVNGIVLHNNRSTYVNIMKVEISFFHVSNYEKHIE